MGLADQVVGALNKNQFLGRGSERKVYSFNKDYVIKIPHSALSRVDGGFVADKQARMELYIWNRVPENLRYLLCPIVTHFEYKGNLVLVMRKRRILHGQVVHNIRRQRNKLLNSDNTKPRELLYHLFVFFGWDNYNEFKEDISQFCDLFELETKEFLENTTNMGLIGSERVEFVDYGHQFPQYDLR